MTGQTTTTYDVGAKVLVEAADNVPAPTKETP